MINPLLHDDRSGQGSRPADAARKMAGIPPYACILPLPRPLGTEAVDRRPPASSNRAIRSTTRRLLRIDPEQDREGIAPIVDDERGPSTAAAGAVLCRQCRHEISAATERRTVNGAHAHTFANPEGIVFEIVCYRNAWGCGYVGPASPFFTWFPGYAWRIAVCGACHTHLGWRFAATDGRFFHGLIVDRIVLLKT